jgi:outer membrane protein assembly factor BamB
MSLTRSLLLTFGWLIVCATANDAAAAEPAESDWPQFRGPNAFGVAAGTSPPLTWDLADDVNVAWQIEVPGLGHACPIVSGDFVFVLTAVSDGDNNDLKVGLYGDIDSVDDDSRQTWKLLCLSRRTGQKFWTRDLHQGVPQIKRHTKATHANSTPAADGRHVVAFLGSEGLYCYDYLGRLLWKKDLGTLDSGYYVAPAAQWGFSSSPIIYDGRVIVQCDVQEGSFLAAYAVETGAELWKTTREDVPTWGTPSIYHDGQRTCIAVNGYRHSGGYDLQTGEEVWRLEGGGDIPVPTPVIANGSIFLSSAHGPSRPLRAVSVQATGTLETPENSQSDEVTSTGSDKVVWWRAKSGIYLPTPIVVGQHLYACSDRGVLSCYDAETGERLYRTRLGSGNKAFTASAVATDEHIYFTAEDGTIFVVKAGPEFELVATNAMNDLCLATPAISRGVLYVRTRNSLYAIGAPPAPAPPLACPPATRCGRRLQLRCQCCP